MAVRQLGFEDLPETLQDDLEEFLTADADYKMMVESAKEDHPEMFKAIDQAHLDRDRRIEVLKEKLKNFVKEHAREDLTVGRCHFGPFEITPQRSRYWDVDAFLTLVDELGITEYCHDERIIIPIEDAHFNIARARKLGILEELIRQGVIALDVKYEVDGTKAEDTLQGNHFRDLRRAAWREEYKSASCKAPKPSTSL